MIQPDGVLGKSGSSDRRFSIRHIATITSTVKAEWPGDVRHGDDVGQAGQVVFVEGDDWADLSTAL